MVRHMRKIFWSCRICGAAWQTVIDRVSIRLPDEYVASICEECIDAMGPDRLPRTKTWHVGRVRD